MEYMTYLPENHPDNIPPLLSRHSSIGDTHRRDLDDFDEDLSEHDCRSSVSTQSSTGSDEEKIFYEDDINRHQTLQEMYEDLQDYLGPEQEGELWKIRE